MAGNFPRAAGIMDLDSDSRFDLVMANRGDKMVSGILNVDGASS